MCMCRHVIGWVGTVLAHGAAMRAPMWASWLPAWLQMAKCLSALLSRHTDTWPQQMHIHGHANCDIWNASSIMWELTFYTKQKSCKMMFNSITFAYSEPFSRTVSCWVRQHTLAGVPAAGVLANCEGRTTGTSTWLGANTWGPVMVNKISA